MFSFQLFWRTLGELSGCPRDTADSQDRGYARWHPRDNGRNE